MLAAWVGPECGRVFFEEGGVILCRLCPLEIPCMHVPRVREKEKRGPDTDNLCEGLLLRADLYFICDVSTPHAQQKDLLEVLSL